MDGLKQFCIKLADTVFRNKYRNIEHRRFIRLINSLTTKFRLIDCQHGRPYSKQVQGSTVNISKEGLCIESSTATVDGVDIFNDAMSPEKCLEIEIYLPEPLEMIMVFGNVVWLDMTPKDKSFLFKAGVHLDFQKCSDGRETWYAFVDQAKKCKRSGRFWQTNAIRL